MSFCSNSLPIQELHERPQDGVSVRLCSVVVGWAFDLVQDFSHLTHAAVDTSLKTAERGGGLSRTVPARVAEDSPCTVRFGLLVCVWEIPLSEHSAKVVQEGAELHLQLIEDVGSLRIQLRHMEMKRGRRMMTGYLKPSQSVNSQ